MSGMMSEGLEDVLGAGWQGPRENGDRKRTNQHPGRDRTTQGRGPRRREFLESIWPSPRRASGVQESGAALGDSTT
jgi:hypothetical protein